MQLMQYKLYNHPIDFPSNRKPHILNIYEDRTLSAKVMHYILDALKVNVKLVSPRNHGSLNTERYIQTNNNFITRQLTGKGRKLQLYVPLTC